MSYNIKHMDWDNREGDYTAEQIAKIIFDIYQDKQKEVLEKVLLCKPSRRTEILNAIDRLGNKLQKQLSMPSMDELVGQMRWKLGDYFQALGGEYELDENRLVKYDTVILPRNILNIKDSEVVGKLIRDIEHSIHIFYNVTPWKGKNHSRTSFRATIKAYTEGSLEYGLEYRDDRPTYESYWKEHTSGALKKLLEEGIPKKRAMELSTKIITAIKANIET